MIAATCIFVVRGSFADQNYVPSGSMTPTIQVGDHILVNKIAFDLKIPFSKASLFRIAEPHRGDVVVFIHPTSGMRMVKRLVGLPGDRMKIRDGFIYVNDKLVAGSEVGIRILTSSNLEEVEYPEQQGNHVATIKRIPSFVRHENFDLTVPDDSYFAMGDNRDNSLDSRYWGFVPRSNLEGRAYAVAYNLNWTPIPIVASQRTLKIID